MSTTSLFMGIAFYAIVAIVMAKVLPTFINDIKDMIKSLKE